MAQSKEYYTSYYQRNKEKKSQDAKKRYKEKRTERLQYSREYHKANPEVARRSGRKYSLSNPEKIKQKNQKRNSSPEHKKMVREHHLKKKYGIDLREYQRMYDSQEGKCAICREFKEKLMVDHDHANGKVRGLLCTYCNTGLGFMKDNILILENSIRYLKENE